MHFFIYKVMLIEEEVLIWNQKMSLVLHRQMYSIKILFKKGKDSISCMIIQSDFSVVERTR